MGYHHWQIVGSSRRQTLRRWHATQAVLTRPPLQLIVGKPAMPIRSFSRKVVISAAEENSVIGYYNYTEDSERGNQLGDSLPTFRLISADRSVMREKKGHFYCAQLQSRQLEEICQSPLLYVFNPNEEPAAGTPEQQNSVFTRLSAI